VFIDLPPERRRYVLLACIAALFTAAIEGTIVATAMPTIVTELGGFALFSWVFAAYMLTQAVTIPIYGRLADLYGRKTIMLIGLAIFLVGSTLCGFAKSMIALVAFRAIQGLGAGAVMPVCMTIIGDIYPPIERVRIQPYLAAVFASSSVAGPLAGAFIVQHFGWPLIFWLNGPICIIAAVMLAIFLTERRMKVEHTIDLFGVLLLMTAIGALLLPLMEANALRWWILPLLAFSALTFFLFMRQERRSPEPLLPVMLWREPTIFASNLGSFLIGATVMAISAFLPIYLQGVMATSVLDAGLGIAVMSLSWPVSAVMATRLTLKTSYRATAIWGSIAFTLSSILLPLVAWITRDSPVPVLGTWWPAGCAALIGAGLGMANASYQVAVQEASGTRARGAATAAYNFMRMLGGTFGTAILGAILNFSVAMRLPDEHDVVQTIMDTDRRTALPVPELQRLTVEIGGALHDAFWALAVIALASIGIARMMPPGTRPGYRSADSMDAAGPH
jgi:EmrB/QacA subfamily drug resistance transporter